MNSGFFSKTHSRIDNHAAVFFAAAVFTPNRRYRIARRALLALNLIFMRSSACVSPFA